MRIRLPVAAKIALQIAGAVGGTPGACGSSPCLNVCGERDFGSAAERETERARAGGTHGRRLRCRQWKLGVIAWVRNRFMDTPLLSAAFQVVVGGLLVFGTGILIGSF